jgi:hypothetical protein
LYRKTRADDRGPAPELMERTPYPTHEELPMIHPFRRLRGTVIRVVVLALVAALAIPINATVATAHPGHGDETFNALVFSKDRRVPAAVALDQFVARARTVRDVPARTLLIAVGQDLEARL